jgi:hypothetical protein
MVLQYIRSLLCAARPNARAAFGQEYIMSNVLQFRRRSPSREVIDKLVELGYLKRALRHNASAIENALARLRDDLCHSQVISASDQMGCYQTATMANSVHKGYNR